MRKLILFLTLAAATAVAQDIASFEKRITVKTLPNGLTVVLMERPEAPVFSFVTHVDAGSAQENVGNTGLAHMFEHMAFKGTDTIGTRDYAAESVALKKVDATYAAYQAENEKVTGRDPARVALLEKAWQQAIDEADQYVVDNEFGQIIESRG